MRTFETYVISLIYPAYEVPALGGQAEPEPGDARLRFGADAAADALDYLLDDGDPDPGAAVRPVSRLLDTVEALEEVGDILLGNCLARIAHTDEHIAPAGLGRDRHQSAVGRIARCILEQVGKHLG